MKNMEAAVSHVQEAAPRLNLVEREAHNAQAAALWLEWRPRPWCMPDPKDRLPTDTGSLRDMIEYQYQRRAK